MTGETIIDIYLRPLKLDDAQTSWRWRNDPEIWKFTGSRPDKHITAEIENKWLASVISDEKSRRFAICIADSSEYIGNIQLTELSSTDAQLHIFIGEKRYWGKGVASSATSKLLDLAFNDLLLDSVYLYVKKTNQAAIAAYKKNGFEIDSDEGDSLKMICFKEAG